jgi:hypothetical protein
MQESIRVGEYIAYRAFSVRGGQLWSIGYGNYLWTPGTNEAYCDKVDKRGKRKVWTNDPLDHDTLIERKVSAGSHGRIPSPSCECGFYAYRTESIARMRLGPTKTLPGRSTRFGLGQFGTDRHETLAMVKLWGRTLPGRDGFRSQFASVLALIVEDPEPFRWVLEAYDIPAVSPTEEVATGYVTSRDGTRVRLMTVVEDLGWFTVGIDFPELGQKVTVEYEEQNDTRVITSFHVHRDEEEFQ